jgi:hypothetical protein
MSIVHYILTRLFSEAGSLSLERNPTATGKIQANISGWVADVAADSGTNFDSTVDFTYIDSTSNPIDAYILG